MVVQSLPICFKSGLPEREGTCRLADPPIALTPTNPDRAEVEWKEWVERAVSKELQAFVTAVEQDGKVADFLRSVYELSPYLAGLARQYPNVVAQCSEHGFQPALDQCLSTIEDLDFFRTADAELCSQLRIAKKQSALICGLADLGGWWSWEKVSRSISRTADSAVQAVVRHLLYGASVAGTLNLSFPDDPVRDCGYIVLAMGKHGSSELNFSSDIDLIVLFDPDVPAIVDRDESVKLFVRMTKNLVRILQDRTADGYVFRTDLRLRPDPGSMPLAVPLPIALNYYESRGQNWERAALIKARPVAGDLEAGVAFLQELTPFVWRRYLDYAAIADVHSIKRQIQTHRGYNEVKVLGHNVKLGRGGIREIEFFVQTQQLIAGGRNPVLREQRTVEMLQLLHDQDWIEQDAASELATCYAFLRDIEHRLQMISDDQTHTLPEDEAGIKRVAHLCGITSVSEFSTQVVRYLETVEKHYADLFASGDQLTTEFGNLSFTGDEDDPGTIDSLRSMGFEQPTRVIAIVKGWHYGRHPVIQSQAAREQLTALTPSLLKAFVETKRADDTLFAFDSFLQGLPGGIQLFSVIQANSKLQTLLVLVLSAAPRLARIITRRPHVFDGVLEPGFFDARPTAELWNAALGRSLNQARDYEDGLDRVRIFAAEQKFLVGIRLISGAITAHEAAEMFSLLGETLLLAVARWVERVFIDEHGQVPGAEYALVAMGNLGTHELTAGSDLDVMLIYQYDPDRSDSDGRRPLDASQYFGRFTQRLIAAMTAPTAQGIVYELDFRLRPHGEAGPIATSLMALERHYDDGAWTWERLALTRARVLGPTNPFSTEVERVIDQAIDGSHQMAPMARDIKKMRKLMDKKRPPRDVWDVKLVKGGLIDIEFLAQMDILFGQTPRHRTTALTLEAMTKNGLHNDNVTLREAQSIYLGVIQVLRLCLDSEVHPQDGPRGMIELLLRQLGQPDMKTAEAFLEDTQQAVRQIFVERVTTYAAHS